MNWLMVAEGRARLGQKPIARKLHLSSPTPTPHPPPPLPPRTTRNSPDFPEWPTFLFLTIQSCENHFSCIRVRIKQTILCQSFSSLQISWSRLVPNYCGNLLAATFNQHCWPLDQPTDQQSNFLLRRHFPLDDWPEPPSSRRLFVHILYQGRIFRSCGYGLNIII